MAGVLRFFPANIFCLGYPHPGTFTRERFQTPHNNNAVAGMKKSAPKIDVTLHAGKAYGRTTQIVANVIGIDRVTYHTWRNQGAPQKTNNGWPITDTIAWAKDTKWGGASIEDSDDPLMFGHNSPALEDYRKAKARLAELDLAEKQGNLLAAEHVEDGLNRVSSLIRGLCEQTKLRFPPEYLELLNQCLDDLEREFSECFPTTT